MIDRAWLSKLRSRWTVLRRDVRRRMRFEPEAQDRRDHAGHSASPRRPRCPSQLPPRIPITALIETSQRHFEAGERELRARPPRYGARVEFDRAVEVLLESPYGARTEPRLREHFDRLVDRINAHEVTALRPGRRLRRKEVRAGLDRRAAEDRDVPEAGRRRGHRRSGQGGPRARPSTTCRFRRTTASSRTSSCSRDACATTSRRA